MLKKLSFNRAAMLGIAALCLVAAPAMYAVPITFTATGALVDGATLSGNVVIDTAAGVVVSTNLNVSSPISLSGLAWASAFGGQGPSEFTLIATPGGINSGNFVALNLPTTTLVGYTGGSICVNSCSGGAAGLTLRRKTPPITFLISCLPAEASLRRPSPPASFW